MARIASSLGRRLAWVGVALAGLVVYGVVGYWRFEGWSFLDAVYMTITTLTTVGFREVRELDTSGRIFTLSLLVLGVGVLLTGISLTAAVSPRPRSADVRGGRGWNGGSERCATTTSCARTDASVERRSASSSTRAHRSSCWTRTRSSKSG